MLTEKVLLCPKPGLINCLFFVFLQLLVNHSLAAEPVVNNLSVSFAVEKHELTGISSFVLPPEEELTLQTTGLLLDRILLNSRQVQLKPVDGYLIFGPASESRSVKIFYRKELSQETKQQRSMISKEGIVLLDHWYPRPMEPVIYKLRAEIPAGFSAVSEADEISYQELAAGRLVTFSFAHPLPNLDFAAGPYEVKETFFGGGKILSTCFFKEDKDLAPVYMKMTRQYLERYEELLGEYPFRRFTVVENRLPTGFAMPTFTLLGQAVVRMPFIKDTSLGHEVLHSWFGNGIMVNDETGNWCEGLTTCLADQAFAADQGRDGSFRKNQLIYYQSYVPADNTMTVRDFKGAIDHLSAGRHIRAVGYNKCAMIFHMLRQKVGDKIFFAALTDFYQKMRYKKAGWNDIQAVFARHYQQDDLSDFFNQWLNRSDIIQLGVEDVAVSQDEGHPVISFTLIQQTETPYVFTLPLVIKTSLEIFHKTISISRKKTRVTIPLETMPEELRLDPDYDLMRQLSPAELPPVWARFLGGEPRIAVVSAVERDKFAPFLDWLTLTGCRIIDDAEMNDKELAQANLIFLGIKTKSCCSLYGRPELPDNGFSLDVRENPLNPEFVSVLVSAGDRRQVAGVVRLLSHYGKYSFLHFADGRIQQKRIAESDQGMVYLLDQPPRGIAVGQSRSFADIFAQMADKRVIYVGEAHTSPEDHLLQLRIIRALYEQGSRIGIGMEMFNRHSRPALDKFINGELEEKDFLREAGYYENWGYDYRLYRDILLFARHHKIPVVGLNLDKEIVSKTFKKEGIAGLDPEIKANLPPDRDLGKPGYRERLRTVYNSHSGSHFTREHFSNFVQAQTLWDETMAESVVAWLKNNPDKKMVVLAGLGHVVKDTGIPPRVNERMSLPSAVAVNIQSQPLNENDADYLFFPVPAPQNPSPLLGVQLKEDDKKLVISGFAHMGSAAQKAGAEKDDILLAIDDQQISGIADVKIGLVFKEKGDKVMLRVRRSRLLLPDRELELEVVL